VHLFSSLNVNARMVCETAEWKGVEEGAAGGDDYGSFFPQMKPNG
jgi:hypothetical protein